MNNAFLLSTLTEEAQKLVRGTSIEHDEAKLEQLAGLDPAEQAPTLRRHLRVGLPWDTSLPQADVVEKSSTEHDTPSSVLHELREADGEPRQVVTIQRWRVDALKPNKWNAALFPDSLSPEGLKPLSEDMDRVGQRTPLVVLPDGTVLDGERRWRGAGILGWVMVDVRVVPAMTDAEVLDAVLSFATSARQMTVREQVLVYRAVAAQLQENSGQKQGRPSTKSSPIGELFLTPKEIAEAAAKRAGFTSVRQAERAEAVFTRGSSELQQEVPTGEKSLTAAYEEVPKQHRKSALQVHSEPMTQGTAAADPSLETLECASVVDDPFEEGQPVPVAARAERSVPAPATGLTPAAAGQTSPSGFVATGNRALLLSARATPASSEQDAEQDAVDPDKCLDILCEHVASLLSQREEDESGEAERYEAAKTEVERIVERVWAALGEPPDLDADDEQLFEDDDDVPVDLDDDDVPSLDEDDEINRSSDWDDLDELIEE